MMSLQRRARGNTITPVTGCPHPARNRNELAWTVVVGDYELGKPGAGKRAVPVRRILPHPKVGGDGPPPPCACHRGPH